MAAAATARVVSKARVRRPKTGPRTVARDFYPVQELDNSKVRRSADPREMQNVLLYLMIGTIVLAGLLGFAWEQFAIIKNNYDIADLKTRRDSLVEANKILHLQSASLRNPERIHNYATLNLGLVQPHEGQVIRMEVPAPAGSSEPVLARLSRGETTRP